MEDRLIETAHRQSIHAPAAEVSGYLQELLSRRLVAYIAGVENAETITRWASGEVDDVSHENERRLRTAYEIAQLLGRFDSPRVVKAWFIGLNPQLGDASPAEAIHHGDLREAMSAVRAFISCN